MTVRKRGKYWEAQVRVKGFPAISRTFDLKSQANAWKAETVASMKAGRWRDPRPAQQMTMGNALDRYCDEYIPRLKDAKRTESRAKFLKKQLGEYALATFGPGELTRFRDQRAAAVSANTVRLDLALLSRLFEVARRDWGLAVENPVIHITKPKTPRGRERRLAEGEEELLIAAAREGRRPIFAELIRFALATGARRGEIACLDWCNINLDRRVAIVRDTKNGETRSLPLSRTAVAILQNLPGDRNGEVWGMTPDAITQAMTRARERAGIDGLTFHDLRHEAISRLFERTDLDALEIASITGHRSMQMLARYTHLRADRLANRLDGRSRIG